MAKRRTIPGRVEERRSGRARDVASARGEVRAPITSCITIHLSTSKVVYIEHQCMKPLCKVLYSEYGMTYDSILLCHSAGSDSEILFQNTHT